MATKTTVDIEVNISPDMLAAGLKVLRNSGAIEHPTGADEVLVADIYKAMAHARHSDAAVQVTVPGVIEPGAELVVKNETRQPIRIVADPHERLKLKVRDRP
jgi:riboflavin biosynthesis pyrimidine reductase